MTTCRHVGQAKQAAVQKLKDALSGEPAIARLLLIDDLFGKLRLVVWPAVTDDQENVRTRDSLDRLMSEAAGPFWSGEVWLAGSTSRTDQLVYEGAWDEGQASDGEPRLRLNRRHRNHGGWFAPFVDPPWPARGESKGPPIVVFYSFKGGVGRSTALAAFAVARAQAGDTVAVIDFDLDAPGVGVLLAQNESEMAEWGVVDYLLDSHVIEHPDLRDYYHRYAVDDAAGNIYVIPAGRVDDDYLGKLARIDLEPPAPNDRAAQTPAPFLRLLHQVQAELRPQWILIDARSGLSNAAGFLVRGLAHLHVLFAAQSEQTWHGLKLLLSRLGESRVLQSLLQLDCLVVQCMICDNSQISEQSRQAFLDRSLDEFTDHYYAEDSGNEATDTFWSVSDSETEDAPHFPVSIHYSQRLASFSDFFEVVPYLLESSDYKALTRRIIERFEGSV
jgi:cellulose biosynthesis protein BcsQ